jgi:hypothetical protein
VFFRNNGFPGHVRCAAGRSAADKDASNFVIISQLCKLLITFEVALISGVIIWVSNCFARLAHTYES